MAPQTRRMEFPKVIIERDNESEQSSSDEEEEEEIVEEEESKNSENEGKNEVVLNAKRKGKAPMTISLKKVCKVSVLSLSLPVRSYFSISCPFFPFNFGF